MKNEFRFYQYQLLKNFKNEKALRLSFGLQIIGMIINNLAFYVIWIYFMKAIGETNGWNVLDTVGLLSVSIFSFGASHVLFGGISELPDKVIKGSFDSMLTKPKSLYFRILNQRFNVSAIGDLLQGSIGIIIYIALAQPDIKQIIILLVMLPPAIIIMAAFNLIADCLIFWFPQSENLNKAFVDLIMLPSTQPITLLGGFMHFMYIFMIPAMLLAGLPMQALKDANMLLIPLAYVIAILWYLLSRYILKRALRRYESANFFG